MAGDAQPQEKHVHPADVEMGDLRQEGGGALLPSTAAGIRKKEDDMVMNIPDMSHIQLFMTFLWFGCRAFGGPIVQIALMKEELVEHQKWISNARFMRALAMYQVLPGPEATELACYFGYLAKGRIGAILGGLGFLLPGVILMLLSSYVYLTYGLADKQAQASFHCIQVVVSALIFRGTYKLAEAVLVEKSTQSFSFINFYMVLWCFLTSVVNLNFFIALAACGIMMTILAQSTSKFKELYVVLFSMLPLAMFAAYVYTYGVPTGSAIGAGVVGESTLSGLFLLGLVAGLVTFGGAYTTLPFIFSAAVENGGWLTQEVFLDSIAITNALPTPLVSFVILPGYYGHGLMGAILICVGIFLPAFSFTLIGHDFFEALMEKNVVKPYLEGVGVGVIGLLIQTSFLFLRAGVETPVDACVFYMALQGAFMWNHKYTQPMLLVTAAIAGQALYAR